MGVFAQSHTRRRRHHLEIDKVKLLLELDKVKLETDQPSQKKPGAVLDRQWHAIGYFRYKHFKKLAKMSDRIA